MVGLPERVVRPLFAEKDAEVREKGIVSIEKAFKSKKDPITGEFRDFSKKKITAGEIRYLLKKMHKELRLPVKMPEGETETLETKETLPGGERRE